MLRPCVRFLPSSAPPASSRRARCAERAGPLTTHVKRTLAITNPNSQPVAFKVKTTAPKVTYPPLSRSLRIRRAMSDHEGCAVVCVSASCTAYDRIRGASSQGRRPRSKVRPNPVFSVQRRSRARERRLSRSLTRTRVSAGCC